MVGIFEKIQHGMVDQFFKDLKIKGYLTKSDLVQAECLLFCFMPLLQDELARTVQEWNLHKIRPLSNESSPPGRPETFFFFFCLNSPVRSLISIMSRQLT